MQSTNLSVNCKLQSCPFSIWFKFETDNDQPVTIEWKRNTTLSHHLDKHQSGIFAAVKKCDLHYE